MARPFLKWPGGKYRLMPAILNTLPQGNALIEPFVGSGAVFLNTDYSRYLLSDANSDLISVYQILQEQGKEFIQACKYFFQAKYNTERQYYKLRAKFNNSQDRYERAILFVYLNRHGFNGLCRYNLQHIFNVPFGRYQKPYFPEKEMYFFYEKSQAARFKCQDFAHSLKGVRKTQVVYCDPPYVPLSDTAYFTSYQAGRFGLPEQKKLAASVQKLAKRGVSVLVSNHDTPFVREVYDGALFTRVQAPRLISCKSSTRKKVNEILALFSE